MSDPAAEFLDVHDQAVAQAEFIRQHGEVMDDLASASGAASAALSKADLLYGPVECGPAVNIERSQLEKEIATAIIALRKARGALAELEQARKEALAESKASVRP